MYHPYPDDRANAIERAQTYVSLNPLFLDTETTGLSNMDEICEIAVVDLAGTVLLNTFVKCTSPIPERTTEIHGITNEMVKRAPTFKDLLPELERLLRDRDVLVYNVEFDTGKLARSAEAAGCGFLPEKAWWGADPDPVDPASRSCWHDVMELYATYHGDWNDYHMSYRWQRLGAAARQCGIELPPGIHRAHADAELTRRIVLHRAEQKLEAANAEGDSRVV